MKSLNILHLTSNDRWTGNAEPIYNLVKSLSNRGHRVYLGFPPGNSMHEHLKDSGLNLLTNLKLHRTINLVNTLIDIKRLIKFCDDKNIDIIHTHMTHDHWIASIAKIFSKSKPLLFRTRHKITKIENDFVHRCLNNKITDCIIILSDKLKEKYIDAMTISPDKVEVVYGAVDSEKYNPENAGSEVKKILGFEPNDKVVGMISHFKPDRGYEYLYQIMPDLKREIPNLKFILAGGKSRYQKGLGERIKKIGLERDVAFILDRRFRWEEVLASFDVSLYLAVGSEGSGRAMLEVMATGKPVIAFDVGVVSETIKDRVSGIIIKQGDIKALKESIMYIIKNSDKAKQMGLEGRRIIENRFTLEKQVNKMEELYFKFCKGHIYASPTKNKSDNKLEKT